MLVLMRRKRERVLCEMGGMKVWVSVERIEGGSVRLGFDAPREVRFVREELLATREGLRREDAGC